VVDIAVPYM